MSDLTEADILSAFPKRMNKHIDSRVLTSMNEVLSNAELTDVYRENIIGYASVLQDGKYSTQAYLNAVKYCSFKMMGDSNQQSWCKTFPDRYNELLAQNVDGNTLTSYVGRYNKTQLVNKIMEQSLIPSHVLNQHMYQDALNTQADLMAHSHSDMVRMHAANSILMQLKMPETSTVELDLNIKSDQSIVDLRATITELTVQQKKMLEAGQTNAKEVAHAPLMIEGETED